MPSNDGSSKLLSGVFAWIEKQPIEKHNKKTLPEPVDQQLGHFHLTQSNTTL